MAAVASDKEEQGEKEEVEEVEDKYRAGALFF